MSRRAVREAARGARRAEVVPAVAGRDLAVPMMGSLPLPGWVVAQLVRVGIDADTGAWL